MEQKHMILFDKVCFAYGTELILDNFSLGIEKGEFITVVGSSGCGKTTMLKMINGLLQPQRGSVWVEGEDVSHTDVIALRRRMGYVIQEVGLFPHMTVEKNIAYVLNLEKKKYTKEEKKNRVYRYAKLVGLSCEMLERYPAEVSGGQKQRVGIARALVHQPHILLMDEPFGAVDEITRRRLQDELKRIYEELQITVVFITHDIKEALKLGTKVLVMDAGRIQQFDTPEVVLQQPATAFVENLVCVK